MAIMTEGESCQYVLSVHFNCIISETFPPSQPSQASASSELSQWKRGPIKQVSTVLKFL